MNTSLVLQLDDEVNTGSAKVGDSFHAHLKNAIILAGGTVAAAGAPVLGHVTFVSRASAPDHDGYVGVRFDPLPLADGASLPLRPLNATWSIHVTAGQQSTSDVKDTLADIFIPYHFLYRQFRKGSNLDLKPGTTVHAITMGTVRMIADVPHVEAIEPVHLGTAVPYSTVTPIPLFTPQPLVKATPKHSPSAKPSSSPTPSASPSPSPSPTTLP
ncbi:MAG: hypothetical protein KGJ86_19740 [Chloroflexota bacterium]|nr:hypothetical protein [Chloroflexota bacterium]